MSPEWRNPSLYDAVGSWLREALALFREYESSLLQASPPSANEELQPDPVLLPDYRGFLITYHQRLLELPAFRSLSTTVRDTPELSSVLLIDAGQKPVSDEASQLWWLWTMYFQHVLSEYLIDSQSSSFDESHFKSAYSLLEDSIYLESFKAITKVELINFDTGDKLYNIDEGVYIRPSTEQEREEIINPFLHISPIRYPDPHLRAPETFLCIEYSVNRFSEGDIAHIQPIAHAILLALRLLGDAAVSIGVWCWSGADQPFLLNQGQQYWNRGSATPPAFGGKYVLTDEAADLLPSVYAKAKLALVDPELQTPLTRLSDSYSRSKLEDKIIDYWIAFESFFFLGDPNVRELGRQVSLGMSHYLGSSHTERQDIYNEISESYQWRNYIVHGMKGRQPKTNLSKSEQQTFSHLRRCMMKRIME